MRIVNIDDTDPETIQILNIQSFQWPIGYENLMELRKADRRMPEYGAFYAVEDDRTVGQVGVLYIDTETKDGKEKVGGIWGVAVHPAHSRKGIAKKLMAAAHERMVEDGIRISFLHTAKSIVAYNIYDRMGYEDFSTYPWAIKRPQEIQGPLDIEVVKAEDSHREAIHKMHRDFAKDYLGFIHRQEDFLKARELLLWFKLENVDVVTKNGEFAGYAATRKDDTQITVQEHVIPDYDVFQQYLWHNENEGKGIVRYTGLHNASQRKDLVKNGYHIEETTWGVMMAAPLVKELSFEDIKGLYGIEEEKFHMQALDMF